MKSFCHYCKTTIENPKIPRCSECGNVYEIIYTYDKFNHILKELHNPITHWKYHTFMPVNFHNSKIITMEEGNTPLMLFNKLKSQKIDNLYFKCEYLNPTGSFKDRASALEVTLAQGYYEIVVATTGNMGSSLATYAAFAGIKCKVFIPNNIHNNKIEHMKLCGAEIIPIEGNYTNAMIAAEEYYINHLESYLAGDYGIRVEGTKSVGFEIWDQLDWNTPDWIIVPVGNGTLLWAIYKAFKDLRDYNIIDKRPKIIGVKSDNPETTIISAIACPKPNAEWILDQVSDDLIEISDNEVMTAREVLGKNGFYVEPAGAVSFAGLQKLDINGDVVCILTGNGLKGV